MVVEGVNLFSIPGSISDMLSSFEHSLDPFDDCKLLLILLLLLSLHSGCKVLKDSRNLLKIFCSQFVVDDLNISNWIKFSFLMDNFFVWEGSNDVVDSVNSRDVRKESITKTCTLTCSFNETSNISDGDLSWDL